MKLCQNNTRRKLRGSFLLCDSGYDYITFPENDVKKLNLRNHTLTTMKRNYIGSRSLKKFCLNKKMLDFLKVEKMNQKNFMKTPEIVFNTLNFSNDFKNYNANKDQKSVIEDKSGVKVLYMTGEYNAYSPISAFIKMLKMSGLKEASAYQSDSNNSEDLGFASYISYKNLSTAKINGSGSWVTKESPLSSLLIIERFQKQ